MKVSPFRLVKLLWPYVLLWFLAAGAVGGYAWHEIASSREREIASGRYEAENLARVLQQEVTHSVEGVERTLVMLRILYQRTRDPAVLAGLSDAFNEGSHSEVERRATRFDREGRLVDSTDQEQRGAAISIADRPWFRTARERSGGEVVIGEPTVIHEWGRMAIPLAVRVEAPDGAFDGVLVTALDPEWIVHMFRTVRVGERPEVGLMDRDGRLYAWSASADPLPPGVAVAGVPRSALTITGEERRALRDVVNPDSVIALSAVPRTGIVAFASFSLDRLLVDQRHYARTIVAFALLTLASLSLPIVLVARRALREVAHLSRLERGFRVEREHARTDSLTGAANRRAFEVALRACHAELASGGRPFVLAVVDIDRFKQLNDTHGHSVGDAALRRIARTLLGGVRRSDMVARLGGDEFAVLMPAGDARSMHRPFDMMFTALTVAVAGAGWPISFSIGVIAFESPIPQPQDATALADKLMYEVKASGRNGVRFAVYREQRLHPDVGGRDASAEPSPAGLRTAPAKGETRTS